MVDPLGPGLSKFIPSQVGKPEDSRKVPFLLPFSPKTKIYKKKSY